MSILRGRQGAAPPDEARPERLDLIVFSRQMAISLRAGIPLIDGIRVVRQQAISGVFRKTLDDVATRLQEGMPLWAALGRHPRVFFDLYVETVRAAEDSGQLATILDRLARDLETSQATSASGQPVRPWVASGDEADPAPTNGAAEPPVPRTAQTAYDELIAKLRGGPILEMAPPPPPRRPWPWQRRKSRSSYMTPTERLAAKRLADAARHGTKHEREAAKQEQQAAKRAARAARAEEKRLSRLAEAEAKRAARAATDKAKAAKAEEKRRAQRVSAEARSATEDARALAKVEKQEKRAAVAAGRRATRAAATGRFGRLLRLTATPTGPVKKDVAGGGSWMERNFSSFQKVKRIDLIIFSRQMATFIRAGIPITDGIRVVREQTRSSLFRRTLDEVTALLESGEPLSAALAQHPRVFPEIYIDMVVAAEATGELDAILDQLAKYMERSDATARQMKQAMLYPSIVLGLACVVVFILMVVVLPSFVALFADFDAVLPLPTQILLALGAFGGTYGIAAGGIVVMILTVLFLVRNTGPLKRLRQRIALRLPVLGTIIKLGIETRFARTLSILHKAGVPIAQSFEIAATGTGNHIYQKRLGPVREALIAGEGISTPLAASRLFGPLLVQMVKVGEETGTLDRYLDEAANFLDEELGYRTKQMVTIIEPLMILGVAGVVGFVALSVITPMYSILQQIH
jgi:type IV pilus assembly protein PilC